MLWQGGWLTAAERLSSPNFDPRPSGPVRLVVLHNISLPPFEYGSGAIAALFQNRIDPQAHPFFPQLTTLRVCSHFVIERSGRLLQFVSCDDAARHAGVSSYKGHSRCNDFSIGIELEGCDFEPFAETQYAVLLTLLKAIFTHYPIEAVCGHQHIAPNRKSDPGHFFEWERLKAAHIPLWLPEAFSR